MTVLALQPHQEGGVSVWNVRSRDENMVSLGRSSVFLTLILAVILLIVTVRPGTSAAAGWTLGAIALIIGAVDRAYVAPPENPGARGVRNGRGVFRGGVHRLRPRGTPPPRCSRRMSGEAMTTPDHTALDVLRDQVENLERAADESNANNVYARCYGILATALFLLSFLPYNTTENGWRDNAWEGPGGGHTGATLNTFAMLFLLPLLFMLLCATVRPGESPWVGWVIGVLALGVGIVTWALALNLNYPSWATTALIVVSFVCAITGFVHGTHRLRIRDGTTYTDL